MSDVTPARSKAATQAKLAPGLAARVAAAGLLAGVLDRGESLGDQLGDSRGPVARLDPAERARAQSLATGALRHLGRIDAVLDAYLGKPPIAPARNALRLATAELFLDGVPAHAAVDGAVRLAREHPKARHLSGLVNAVARRIAEGGAAHWDAAPESDLPGWFADPVAAAYGADALASIAAVHHRAPPIDLTLRDAATGTGWAERLGAEILPTGSLRLRDRVRVSGLPGYASGEWWVQDAAAALPARMLGDVRGRRVLDLCAAPGGKTLQLAAAGAHVTALDISARRLERLRENLTRTKLSAEIVAADALNWTPKALFDAILLDAPCSATGTVRRHPDLPYLRSGDEVPALTALQSALFARAWNWLAPGGRLVFCTCSLLPAEGPERIARFLAETPGARQIPPDPISGLDPSWLDGAGALRTRPDFWPDLGGMDGFYAALLQRPGAKRRKRATPRRQSGPRAVKSRQNRFNTRRAML